ncbi:hypothetical protein B0H14DRAFT_3691362 [Mycena olivaceomarginata]|nr:hypothetical protein B0H14DRAFT_3691362 [Mycena olivaceomarginata]
MPSQHTAREVLWTKPGCRRTINSLTTHTAVYNEHLPPPNNELRIPVPPSRSPSPSTEVIPYNRGGHRFTSADRLSRNELCEALAAKAPHHNARSWEGYWSKNHDLPDKILAAYYPDSESELTELSDDDDNLDTSPEQTATGGTGTHFAKVKAPQAASGENSDPTGIDQMKAKQTRRRRHMEVAPLGFRDAPAPHKECRSLHQHSLALDAPSRPSLSVPEGLANHGVILSNLARLLAEIGTLRTEVADLRATLVDREAVLPTRGESPQVTFRTHPLHHLIYGEPSRTNEDPR